MRNEGIVVIEQKKEITRLFFCSSILLLKLETGRRCYFINYNRNLV